MIRRPFVRHPLPPCFDSSFGHMQGHWWAHSPLMAAKTLDAAGEIKLVGSAQGCDIELANSTGGIAAAVAL